MFWVWLMGLVSVFLLGWFGYKLFSGGTPKLVVSGGHHDHDHSDDGSAGGHGEGGAGGNSTDASQGSDGASGSSAGTASGSSATSTGASGDLSNNASGSSASGSSASDSSSSSAATGAIAAAGAGAAAVAATAAAAAGAMKSSNAGKQSGPGPQSTANPIVYENVTSGSDISGSGNGSTGYARGVQDAVASEDAASVREMIKILNLRDSDASRLGVGKSQFESLWQGNNDGVDAALLSSVRSRLMHMMS